ncbi:OJ1402_H07.6 [Oryza sativa (japonica cultivar-group)]
MTSPNWCYCASTPTNGPQYGGSVRTDDPSVLDLGYTLNCVASQLKSSDFSGHKYFLNQLQGSDTLEDSGRYMITTIVIQAWQQANKHPSAFANYFLPCKNSVFNLSSFPTDDNFHIKRDVNN